MNRSSLALFLSFVSFAFAGSACSAPTDSTEPSGASPAAASPQGSPSALAAPPALDFTPSNVDLTGIDVASLGDVVVSDPLCQLHSERDQHGCARGGAVAFKIVDQPGAGKIGVYVARSWRVEASAKVEVQGTNAIALVALDTFDVRGIVDASARWASDSPGGASGRSGSIDPAEGRGAGAGHAGTSVSGASGGGYCGAGGRGASASGPGVEGGGASGSPTLSPLVGGSSGGKGHLTAGSGGGAIQVVAGRKIVVAATGVIGANGAGGTFSGAVRSQPASGGGSGGAILLEANEVEVLGTLSANGGAGGGNLDRRGQDGQSGDVAATCEYTSEGSAGGEGSAAARVAGGDGVASVDLAGTGGGGGAGRIRINAGRSTITGRVSPEVGACATEGGLRR